MEKRVNELPDLGFDPADEQGYWKTIAQITFAFNNADAIRWLIERGKYV